MKRHPVIGRIYERSRTFSQSDFDAFARLSGDCNPIHVDPEFSAQTRFGQTVAHGMLLYSCIRALIDEHFPGWHQQYQDLMFPAPTYTGEEMRVRLQPMAEDEPGRLLIRTQVLRLADRGVTCHGTTLLVHPEAAWRLWAGGDR